MYSLKRVRDGAGDSGTMCKIIEWDKETERAVEITENARPKVGVSIMVGSHSARSYSNQDWWMTTVITEIIEDTGDYVRFRTGNSEYEWTERK